MSNGSTDSTDYFPGEWSFEAIQAKRQAELRERVLRRRASPTNLPVRPSIEYYRKLAHERHRDARAKEPSATLDGEQLAIARQYGYVSWPTFVGAVEKRNAAAAELRAALERADEQAVDWFVRSDRDAVLDVGAVAMVQSLTMLVHAICEIEDSAHDDIFSALLDVVVECHPADGIEPCVELLLQAGADPDYANIVLQERLDRIGASAQNSHDAEELEAALGTVANYWDYPEIEHMSDWDD